MTEHSGQIMDIPHSGHLGFSFSSVTAMNPAPPDVKKISPAKNLKSGYGWFTVCVKPFDISPDKLPTLPAIETELVSYQQVPTSWAYFAVIKRHSSAAWAFQLINPRIRSRSQVSRFHAFCMTACNICSLPALSQERNSPL